MYLTRLAWTAPVIFKLMITIYLIYLAITGNYSIGIDILIIIGCIILNIQHVIIFTPLINMTLQRGIDPVLTKFLDQHTDTYITGDELIVDNAALYSEVPFSDIRHVRKLTNAIAVYLPKNAILTIPTEGVDTKTITKAVSLISYWSKYKYKKSKANHT